MRCALRMESIAKRHKHVNHLEVIGEFTFGMALRLSRQSAAGLVRLDEATLTSIAKACWDAIAR